MIEMNNGASAEVWNGAVRVGAEAGTKRKAQVKDDFPQAFELKSSRQMTFLVVI